MELEEVECAFRPMPTGLCINHILCILRQHTHDSGDIFSFYGRRFEIVKPEKVQEKPVLKERETWPPPNNHYHKYGYRLMKKGAFTPRMIRKYS